MVTVDKNNSMYIIPQESYQRNHKKNEDDLLLTTPHNGLPELCNLAIA